MSNQTRLNSFDASNVDMNGYLSSPMSQDQSASFPSLYQMPHGSIPMGQTFDTMQHGGWPFHLASMQGGQGAPMPPGPNGMMGMPTDFSNFSPAGPSSSMAHPLSSPAPANTPMPNRTASNPSMMQRSMNEQRSASTSFSATGHTPSIRHVSQPMTHTPARTPRGNIKVPSDMGGSTPATPVPDSADNSMTGSTPMSVNMGPSSARANAKRRTPAKGEKDSKTGRRKIKIEFIDDDSRRHITFSKRKAGIMKKAYELATLTGTQVLLLVVSQTGLVYTFTTPKLEAVVKEPEGRNLIQECLNAPDPVKPSAGGANMPGPSSMPIMKEDYVDNEEEGDEDEDEDEDAIGMDPSRADAGFTAQAIGATPVGDGPVFPHATAPLFNPGWGAQTPGAVGSSKRVDGVEPSPVAALKRRRTQPNLSVSMPGMWMGPSPELPAQYYHPNAMMPMSSMNDNLMQSMPMLFGQPTITSEQLATSPSSGTGPNTPTIPTNTTPSTAAGTSTSPNAASSSHDTSKTT